MNVVKHRILNSRKKIVTVLKIEAYFNYLSCTQSQIKKIHIIVKLIHSSLRSESKM